MLRMVTQPVIIHKEAPFNTIESKGLFSLLIDRRFLKGLLWRHQKMCKDDDALHPWESYDTQHTVEFSLSNFFPYSNRALNVCLLFPTVPCAPANPQAMHSCSSNVIVFNWESTNNTFYYVATAEDNVGEVTECRTTDNMCYFTNTGCGQFYKYNVYAVSHCNSEVSQPKFVRTCE